MINCATGLMDRYRVDGIDYLAENAFQPLVIGDDDDPWGMNVQGFREVVGRFSLMSPAEGTAFSGVRERVLDSVRVIEDGAVRTVVEAVFSYGHSFVVLAIQAPKTGHGDRSPGPGAVEREEPHAQARAPNAVP